MLNRSPVCAVLPNPSVAAVKAYFAVELLGAPCQPTKDNLTTSFQARRKCLTADLLFSANNYYES